MTYRVLIGIKASKFLSTLTDNSQRRIKNKCKVLVEDPYPGQGGDKKLIERGRKSAYRLHVARSYTVFYRINENDKEVKILKITTIEQAHKLYGRLDL
ncbi:MAG: hypothetical protein A4E49_00279 [Methanosaeta sp. PtaU1.Bin112]|nr:MAG: hypothetical protein A4E49_00279 [Methanosaeta sp. PtaU1.Bin112]